MNQKFNKNLKISKSSKNSEIPTGASFFAPILEFYHRFSLGTFLSSDFFCESTMSDELPKLDHDADPADPDGSSPMDESNDQETATPLASDGASPTGTAALPAAANTVPTNAVVLPKFATPNFAEMFKAAGASSAGPPPAFGPLVFGDHATGAPPASGYLPTIDDYVNVYENYILTTHILLVCFIPLRINHSEFCTLMDQIQNTLKITQPTRYYAAAEFGQRFDAATSNPWMEDGFAFPEEEQGHATYILTLPENIPFG